jgi:hypothetical protein
MQKAPCVRLGEMPDQDAGIRNYGGLTGKSL